MRPLLILCLFLHLQQPATAQPGDSLYFHITIDSCTIGSTILNVSEANFYLTVKNTSPIFPLFKKGKVELGIKLYVNRISEDGETFRIIKHIFMEKKDMEWQPISTSDYAPVAEYGSNRSIKIGSTKEIPDFFIQYAISASSIKPDEREEKGILQLIPSFDNRKKDTIKLRN
jgi:hypothetical protein